MKALRCLTEAFSWLGRPELRLFIWVPLILNTLLFGGAVWWLTAYFDRLMQRFLPDSSWLHYIRWLAWPLLALALIITVFYTFSLLANIIAAPFNGFLAEAVERIDSGIKPDSGRSLSQEIWVSIVQEIGKTVFFLSRAIPILILSFIPALNLIAPFLWFLYAAWTSYLQYMDYPMANNGILFAQQRRILAGKPLDTWSFGGLTAVMLNIPILNLIAMPAAVIGAALHWSRNVRPSLAG